MDALKVITEGMIKEDRPHVKVGDIVKVHVKIREGERERIQVFEGTIIAVKGSGVSETLPFAAFLTASAWKEFSL